MKVVAVTSGKGGVGKTLTTVNFAVAARKAGLSVLILDGDFGLANVDVVLGIQPRYNIRDLLDGLCGFEDVICEGPLGIRLISSGSGIASLSQLTPAQKIQISDQFSAVKTRYDLLLIDTGAGISDLVLHLNSIAHRSLVVTTPEPHALTDAYALIKVLAEDYRIKSFDLLVNQARSEAEGLKISERIAEVAKRFLDVRVSFAGHVPSDPSVSKAVMQCRAASEHSSLTLAGQAWTQIARRLVDTTPNKTTHARPGQSHDFWSDLLGARAIGF
jgi:flagellar biosynthesis protein FlhG